MNKSLALKNKFYLFFLLMLSLFISIYLFYFLINGERGIISYFKIKNSNLNYKTLLFDLNNKNDFLLNRIERLKTDNIDLDFVDEKIREKTGFIENNEILLKFD